MRTEGPQTMIPVKMCAIGVDYLLIYFSEGKGGVARNDLTRTACEYKERGIRQDGIRRRRRTKSDDEPRLNKAQEVARAANEIVKIINR